MKLKQEVYDLYDSYVHSKIDRREFMEKVSVYAVGGLTVGAILDFLLPNYQDKQQVSADDPRVKTEYIRIYSAYLGDSGEGKKIARQELAEVSA